MGEEEKESRHWLDQDEPCPCMDHVIEMPGESGSPEDAAALGHSGHWDPRSTFEDWKVPDTQFPAVRMP
jgi:hypothetical protein